MTHTCNESGTNCSTHTAVFLEQVPTLTTKHAEGLPIFFGRRATRKKLIVVAGRIWSSRAGRWEWKKM